jgi:hypothetical protein
MILPSDPPWRYNFDSNRSERDQSHTPVFPASADDNLNLIRDLQLLLPQRPQVGRRLKTHRGRHHVRPRHNQLTNSAKHY